MKIVFLDAFTANPGDQSWSAFEALGECAFYDRTPVSEIVERAEEAEIIITNKAPLTRETLLALPKLKYIGVIATGYNIVDVTAAKERGILVANVPGYGTPSVAQAVIAMMLEMTNHTAHHAKTVREGRWSSCPDFCYWDFPIMELQGRTLGLVGFGDIGSAVARVALAFGMNVIAARRSWTVPPPEGVVPATVDEVLEKSDVISLHCPLTEETRHLINAESLARMKRSALLINTARGPLVDESALAAALNDGTIAGAAVDVVSSEPPPETNPLLQAKNCLITPHLAWASREARTRLIAAAAENVKAFINGAPTNVVNP